MNQPTIEQAKQLAYALRARGVIVLTFGDGRVAGSSYGMTRQECRALGKTLDAIVDGLLKGELPLPQE